MGVLGSETWTEFDRQRDWVQRSAEAEATVRSRRSGKSTQSRGTRALPMHRPWTSPKSFSVEMLESEDPTLTVKRISWPSPLSTHDCCQPGQCKCGRRVQIQTAFEVREFEMDTYPTLLRRGTDPKALTLPSLKGKPSTLEKPSPPRKDPVQTAHDLLQKRLGLRVQSSLPRLPEPPEEPPEEMLRRRLHREKWAADRDELLEHIALIREQLHSPVQQDREVTQSREKLKDALDLSLQGLLSLLEEGKGPRKAVAEDAVPELLRQAGTDEKPFASYKHSVKICSWRHAGMGTSS